MKKDKVYQYIQDRIDEVFGDIPFSNIEDGRKYVKKFNGLLIWMKKEEK